MWNASFLVARFFQLTLLMLLLFSVELVFWFDLTYFSIDALHTTPEGVSTMGRGVNNYMIEYL